jgi:hypothetical protein
MNGKCILGKPRARRDEESQRAAPWLLARCMRQDGLRVLPDNPQSERIAKDAPVLEHLMCRAMYGRRARCDWGHPAP